MIPQCIRASRNTYTRLLKDCGRTKALGEGKHIHAHVISSGLDLDTYLWNTLVDMYGCCGSLSDAHRLFDRTVEPNEFSWTILVSAYSKNGRDEEAFGLFERMQCGGVKPDKVTYVSVLKTCADMVDMERGRKVHAIVKENGFEADTFVGSALICMYVKCGNVEAAEQVFDGMVECDAIAWNAMIKGYTRHGRPEEAFELLVQMQHEGVNPDKATFVILLKACANLGALEQGKRMHAWIKRNNLEADVFVGSALVDMYVKCASLENARQVFDKTFNRDVVSWSAMIAGYAQHGLGKEALALYEQMQQEGVNPDKVTCVSALVACAGLGALEEGKLVHGSINKNSFEADIYVGSALIDVYAKCGIIEDAQRVFDRMLERNVVSWSAMIAGYVHHGHGKKALAMFEQMQEEGVRPNKITFMSTLKACSDLAALDWGKSVHASVMINGLGMDIDVGNTLLDMYVKCGSLEEACRLLGEMRERNVVTWSTMIAGYAQHGHGDKALATYKQMQQEGVKPNEFTFVSILRACSDLAALEWGKRVHAIVEENGLLVNVFVGNALIDMYVKCGSIDNAWRMFDGMPERNVISWNTMIMGHGERAFSLFERMQEEGGVDPDRVTFVSTLKACADVAALERGKLVHASIKKSGYAMDAFVGNALVGMYSKCGSVGDARRVFDGMPERNVVSWNVMIAGYAHNGCGEEALSLFRHMERESVTPDKITFTSLLSACNHAGFVGEGCNLFKSMTQKYGLVPTSEHYSCMVALLGHTGDLIEAEELVSKSLATQPDALPWKALLGVLSESTPSMYSCCGSSSAV